jgi:hypothetical protein
MVQLRGDDNESESAAFRLRHTVGVLEIERFGAQRRRVRSTFTKSDKNRRRRNCNNSIGGAVGQLGIQEVRVRQSDSAEVRVEADGSWDYPKSFAEWPTYHQRHTNVSL